jgi:hypothetical protein
MTPTALERFPERRHGRRDARARPSTSMPPERAPAVCLNILIGLVITSAAGLALAGAFNPISVAFAVLFVGVGADFAIQYSVRYRAQRHEKVDLKSALVGAARLVGAPLTLAALAAAADFLFRADRLPRRRRAWSLCGEPELMGASFSTLMGGSSSKKRGDLPCGSRTVSRLGASKSRSCIQSPSPRAGRSGFRPSDRDSQRSPISA